MENLVFKNTYLNIIIGGLLVIISLLGYFLGWVEDYLPYVIAVVLILLSTKRFIYTFKKITSKNATLILVVEFLLDLLFAGLLIYLQDHVGLFIGLIIYIRGVAYLLINYIATRKIKLLQYVFNIGYVTIGAFLMFTGIDLDAALILGISILILLLGAIYLQAGIVELVRKEEQEEAVKKEQKEELKLAKKEQDEKQKHQEKIDVLQEKLDSVEQKQKKMMQEQKETKVQMKETKQEVKETKQEVEEVVKQEPKKPAYETMTVAELKAIAKEKQLTGYSQFTKAELIKLLKAQK